MRVIFRKQIHAVFAAVSSLDVWLQREFEIPPDLIPLLQAGATFSSGDFQAEIILVHLRSDPAYHVELWTEADTTLYDAALRATSHEGLESIVQDYLDQGWERTP